MSWPVWYAMYLVCGAINYVAFDGTCKPVFLSNGKFHRTHFLGAKTGVTLCSFILTPFVLCVAAYHYVSHRREHEEIELREREKMLPDLDYGVRSDEELKDQIDALEDSGKQKTEPVPSNNTAVQGQDELQSRPHARYLVTHCICGAEINLEKVTLRHDDIYLVLMYGADGPIFVFWHEEGNKFHPCAMCDIISCENEACDFSKTPELIDKHRPYCCVQLSSIRFNEDGSWELMGEGRETFDNFGIEH